MEIRDPVHGSIFYSDQEVAILDTPEFQRLRAIKQLGFSEFSFPGATHNRYLHSLGVGHIAGQMFDSCFKAFPFSKNQARLRLRQATRLAALLHDSGHGPLSHTTEQVMPQLRDLKIDAYTKFATPESDRLHVDRRANHEDYTIKYVTDSTISKTIEECFPDLLPIHVACLIDKSLKCPDDFFIDNGIDFRPILSQFVSSELDADRMDYLERDSYFCGTNYGKIDHEWLIQNITPHILDGKAYMAINRRALYSFDDFLISRHHMYLMVYFHHKSIIYEEMLNRYMTSSDCTFVLPGDITEYTNYNDAKLQVHLATVDNPWARRIAERKPFRVLLEIHSTGDGTRPESIKAILQTENIDCIWASSSTRLSKYHTITPEDRALDIYVVDSYDPFDRPAPIDKSTEIFKRYEGTRVIDRLYVAPENLARAKAMITERKL